MLVLLWILGVLLALAAVWLICLLPRMGNRPDFSPFRGVDYAHRGYHEKDQSVPENSLEAFRRAAENGFGIELDVQLSADGQVVVFHDETLTRMCGREQALGGMTYEELKQVPLRGTGEHPPLFSEVLALVDGRVPFIIEVKGYSRCDELCEKTLALLCGYRGAWCMESFHPGIVAWFRKHAPRAVRGQLSMNYRKGRDMGRLKAFFGRNLFANIYTRPDFIAYCYQDRQNVSLRVCKALWRVHEVNWTLRSPEELKNVRANGSLGIFENFDPREQ